MDKFDDLFNNFFNGKGNNKPNKINDILDGLRKSMTEKEAKKLIEIIKGISEESENDTDEGLNKRIENKLGEPHEIEHSFDGDMYFEKRMWYTEGGVIIKTLMSSEPFDDEDNNVSLEEQMAEAVENEDYILAAELKKQIKKEIAKKKRQEKKLKDI